MHVAEYVSPYAALVRERLMRQAEARRLVMFLVSLLIIFGLCLIYLNLRSQVAKRSYELRMLTLQRDEIRRDIMDLNYEIAKETAPQSLERKALSLGLVPITQTHGLYIQRLPSGLEDRRSAGARP